MGLLSESKYLTAILLPQLCYSRQLCKEIQAATFDTCGCEPLFYDPDLIRDPAVHTNETEICFVCGAEDAVVTQPDQHVILPTTSITCAELAAAAMMGQYSGSYCREQIQPTVQSVCGCAKLFVPDDGIQFHQGSLDTPPAPSASPSPTISQHPAAEVSEIGDGFLCQICGSNGTVINPDIFVSLQNGITTCSGLEAAGLAGLFDDSYCLEEVIPLAYEHFCCSSDYTGVTSEPTSFPSVASTIETSVSPNVAQPPTAAPIQIGSQRFEPGSKYQYKEALSNMPEGTENVVCKVCGEDGTIQDRTKLVDLDEGVTTCGALEEAGLSKVFSHTFCENEAKPVAASDCGCISGDSDGALQVSALSSTSTKHQVDPAEVNVGIETNSSAGAFSLTVAITMGAWACSYIL